jgi:hypothetical protein
LGTIQDSCKLLENIHGAEAQAVMKTWMGFADPKGRKSRWKKQGNGHYGYKRYRKIRKEGGKQVWLTFDPFVRKEDCFWVVTTASEMHPPNISPPPYLYLDQKPQTY